MPAADIRSLLDQLAALPADRDVEAERLQSRLPRGLRDLLGVPGVGPKTARSLWLQGGIDSVDALEHAARDGRLAALPRMGEQRIDSLVEGIGTWRRRVGRPPLSHALRAAEPLLATLRALPSTDRAELAGDARRRTSVVPTVALVVASRDRPAAEAAIAQLPGAGELEQPTDGTTRLRLSTGHRVELHFVDAAHFGAGWLEHTGSRLHVRALRNLAKKQGLELCHDGLVRRGDRTLVDRCAGEAELYAALGLRFVPPELRENKGELRMAAESGLPELVTADDLCGDLHMHTTASDGRGSIEQMVDAARDLGLAYIALTEHSQNTAIAGGLDATALREHIAAIREVNARYDDIEVLAGIEVDILLDGSLDLDEEVLLELDWVVASVHDHFHLSAEHMSTRIERAMATGLVDCIGHPTGRKLGVREPYALHLDRLVDAAAAQGVALEVNGNPRRMDLDGDACRRCRAAGVPVVIDTDAHAPEHLSERRFGVWPARRGGLAAADVLNSRPWSEVRAWRQARLQRRRAVMPPGEDVT